MAETYDVDLQLDLKVPMRDGVGLSADIYRPRAPGRFPTVLIRTPYDNNSLIAKARSLANRGYVCVAQDCRGRWDSDGSYYPFHPDGEDGYDTQEWIGRQEWSNGKIGMSGASYLGLVQWQSAVHASEHLTCMAPRVICADFYQGLVHPGGALQLGVCMTWGMRTNGRTAQDIDYHNWTEAFRGLPIAGIDELAGRRMQFWKDWVDHPCYDDYWKAVDVEMRFGDIRAPAFNMGGWYDLYARDTFVCFNGLRRQGATPEAKRSKLIVGPWPHSLSTSTRTGDVDFGADSMVDLEGLELRWFDYWLKGSTTASPASRPCGCSSWAATSGGTSTSGRWRAPTGRSGTSIRRAAPTPCSATGRFRPRHPATSPPTGSCTIPGTRCRPTGATTAAPPTSSPGALTISARSRCGETCSATRARRCGRRWK